jgi:hypothetical protein
MTTSNKFTHQDYENMQSRWQMCRDAAAGEHEVHSKREAYLPKLEQESDKSYSTRLMMTPFFGATWRTIITLRGMMFRRDPMVVVPNAMIDDLNNIDYTGRSLVSFSQNISLEALTVGRVGILTEYSMVPEGVTEADARKAGARSFLKSYTAESILDWAHANEGGRKKLSMVRLLEDSSNYNDLVEIESHEQIHRVLELVNGVYTQRLFKVGQRGEEEQVGGDIIPKMNGATLNFIPFQPIGVDSLEMDVEIPPLVDLVTMNFHHYRQSSSYERGCFISGLPTLMIYGNNDDSKVIYVGGSMANSFPDPSARAEFVEVGSSFAALVGNLDKKEQYMAVLGARMLESRKAGVESGAAWERKQAGEESVLADIATTISNGLTQSLKWLAEWNGHDPEDVKFELNREFLPYSMTAQDIQAYMQAYLGNVISYDTLHHNFNKAGLYAPGSTKEDEKEMIDNAAPGMPTL